MRAGEAWFGEFRLGRVRTALLRGLAVPDEQAARGIVLPRSVSRFLLPRPGLRIVPAGGGFRASPLFGDSVGSGLLSCPRLGSRQNRCVAAVVAAELIGHVVVD
jgi:hypothetical protein